MASDRPPTIDTAAAERWHAHAPACSPWLHEEVARRMEQRLAWIREAPLGWCHWDPVRGGLETHALLRSRFPKVPCTVYESATHLEPKAREALRPPLWGAERWTRGSVTFGTPPAGSVQMLWANMALHMAADPRALIAAWHRAIAVDGYLMFSCFGPDTLRELRDLYAQQGWPPPSHAFTDMHDWGDMLIDAGFAEPVMDMERITLTFASPARLLQELRELGANLHIARFSSLRGRAWQQRLHAVLEESMRGPPSERELSLSFEIVYGHAFKPALRVPVSSQAQVSLDTMRQMLRDKPRRPS